MLFGSVPRWGIKYFSGHQNVSEYQIKMFEKGQHLIWREDSRTQKLCKFISLFQCPKTDQMCFRSLNLTDGLSSFYRLHPPPVRPTGSGQSSAVFWLFWFLCQCKQQCKQILSFCFTSWSKTICSVPLLSVRTASWFSWVLFGLSEQPAWNILVSWPWSVLCLLTIMNVTN